MDKKHSATAMKLWKATQATAAVEFAFVLPLMLLILLGGFELSRASAVSRKVTLTTRTVADLTTQNVTLSSSSLGVILNASAQIFAPFSNTGMSIVVSELYVSAAGISTVVWSQTLNGSALHPGQVELLPSTMVQPNTYVIWCTVTYLYQPLVTSMFGTTKTFSDQIYMSPRLSASISLSD